MLIFKIVPPIIGVASCPLYPPKADMARHGCDVRFVPTADIPPLRLKSCTFALLATDDRALQCSGWSGDAARSPASAHRRLLSAIRLQRHRAENGPPCHRSMARSR